MAGFVYSQVLYAAVRSGLLERLRGGPADLEAVAAATGLSADGAERLLRAAASLSLVERAGERWALGGEGAAVLGAPGVVAMIEHHRLFYADLADPVALLAGPPGGARLPGFWDYGPNGEAAAGSYSALMAASQPMIADQLLGAYPIRRHRALLDVGGGQGAFLIRAAAAAPALRLGLFDLPAVTERALEKLEMAGLAARAALHPGDFLRDSPPAGYDLVTLNRVLHDHDDPAALMLLRNIRGSLEPGARLLLCEPMAAEREPAGDAYFGLYLWAMGRGRPRTPAIIRAMLRQAGFKRTRELSTALPAMARLIAAEA